MKKILFSFFCMILAVSLCGCSEDETPGFGSVYGIVTDAETSQPVYGASVILSPGNLSTLTGQDGHYEFVDLEPGQYKVQVQANGYQQNVRQIQVNAGGSATGDMSLEPISESSNLTLSSGTLDFDTGYNELTLTLTNSGNAGNVSWNVSGINVAWLTIQPAQGEIAMGKSAEIKVLIDRSQITASQSTSFIINAAGGSQSVRVLVSTQGESGGNEGGGEGGTDGGDYSSAEIISCDSRIEASIVGCERSGSAVVFTYTLKNMGLGLVNDFRIYHPEALGQNNIDGSTSLFCDAEGNEYSDCIMTFRDESESGSNITAAFPENIACRGTVTLRNVPAGVDKINAVLSVFAYPDSEYNLAGTTITFKNVPVY